MPKIFLKKTFQLIGMGVRVREERVQGRPRRRKERRGRTPAEKGVPGVEINVQIVQTLNEVPAALEIRSL
ncbi:hypothetical protein P9443_12275 [Peribacillus frigoritolerans]|uniref:hypothetical protein n=1 Tax=Peribacillus frigoritolerans TaxID=450367 RepID=UPI002E1B3C50|nr:hypothetical protein [Peribacillus frigoritolerans]